MINLFYMLVFLLKGYLPWMSFIERFEGKIDKIEYIKNINTLKSECEPEVLCRDLPSKFFSINYLTLLYSLISYHI